MGRNDLCFCGSGKKTKKCHPDVNENSTVANLLRVYQQLDQYINQQAERPDILHICKQGCSDCCYDYFYVSEIEYYAILNYLLTRNDVDYLKNLNFKAFLVMDELKAYFPEEHSKLTTHYHGISVPQMALDDTGIFRTKSPCIFLDETTKGCTIYQVRPIICRTYGTCMYSDRCDKVKNGLEKSNKSLVDIAPYSQLIDNNIDTFMIAGRRYAERAYPLVYWFSYYLQHYLQKQNAKYYCSIGRSISDYKNLIFNLCTR